MQMLQVTLLPHRTMRLGWIQSVFLSMRDLQGEITLTNLSGRTVPSSRARNSTVVLVWKLLMVCFLAEAGYFV